MSDELVLVPRNELELHCVNGHDRCDGGAFEGCPYCEYRVPPIPRDVWDAMVEKGAAGMYGKHWDGPADKMPGDKMKDVWRDYACRCLRAALNNPEVGGE